MFSSKLLETSHSNETNCSNSEKHNDCKFEFDGRGGELAHSWPTGNVHFDDDEEYKADPKSGIYLLRVAVHEIGHVLSLQVHNNNNMLIVQYPVQWTSYRNNPCSLPFCSNGVQLTGCISCIIITFQTLLNNA